MLLLTHSRSVTAARSHATRLRQLHDEATSALQRLNAALAAASPAAIRNAGLAPRFCLYAPESANPIPQPGGLPLPPTMRYAPPDNSALAAEAKRLGVPQSEILRRFGIGQGTTKPKGTTKQPAPKSLPTPTEARISALLADI